MSRTRLATVEWRDSCSLQGPPWWNQRSLDEAGELCPLVTSTGNVVRKTKDYVVLAMGVTDEMDGQFSDPFVIPRGCIKRMRYL